MITLTSREARALDARIQEELKVPALVLMENAGAEVAREAQKTGKKKIAVVCGKGNNGGDGFVCCRHLAAAGIGADLFLASGAEEVTGEARINLDILLALGQKVILPREAAGGLARKQYSLIIDALFGVGLSGPVRPPYDGLIAAMNASCAQVLAVDIPSGLNADTGEVMGCCVSADMTVTFIAPKRGMTVGSGPAHCGKVIVRGLGVTVPGYR